MSDSYTEHSTEESVTALQSKAEYENAINLSQHVPAAKIISEMVLDAFHTSKESDQIRELRVAIRQAHDAFDDDKAYDLMGQLKQLKDAEAADNIALEDLSSKFSISRILSSFKDDPEFQELVYGLALKVLNQSHQAISNPSAGKSKAARAKKEAEVFVISKDGISVTLPLRTPRSKLNVDREALEFLGFTFVGEGNEAELESETFVDNSGVEQPVTRKSIVTALQQQSAFDGYAITAQ
ncbi:MULTISPECIES: hypothetical protein [Pseudomonas]|jgi:hypothetical protein|uniref:hypothetical protein n=1 Tax=Pseudomonas TaxID=286 RepID=UPI000D0D3DB5|nr:MULTISPECIES: hypothetical protein [Pseudomonas]AZF65963.1 hypothetical protein C4J83_5000 [Pseudomonas sp. LBUM920]MBK3507363.1 hypothetical protein [Pseudomonas sp. MF6747]MBT0623984.1 hypothetical protein [Pseudomonas fluorescens]PSL92984.1 hypothetical protein C7U57_15900 [Pseudomonas sp. R9.37]QJI13702.1 hypothetical protein HKK58_14565 [Pseudomonas sp. ADAK22]